MSVLQALDIGLAFLVFAVAAWTIFAHGAFAATVGYVVYGLLLSLVWIRLFAVDVARRAVFATGRARRPACMTFNCDCRFGRDFARPFPDDRVRLTSIYSKGDAVVHWQRQVIPQANCIEVTGSHVGLIFNRKAYSAVASALSVPELPVPSKQLPHLRST